MISQFFSFRILFNLKFVLFEKKSRYKLIKAAYAIITRQLDEFLELALRIVVHVACLQRLEHGRLPRVVVVVPVLGQHPDLLENFDILNKNKHKYLK